MTCQEAVALLGDYLEIALGPEAIADLERHLGGCAPCVAYLSAVRGTRRAAAEAGRVEMSDEMKARLRSFLVDRLR